MAIFEVRVVLKFGDRHWENVYHVDTVAAEDVAPEVITALFDFYVSRTISLFVIERIVRRVLGTHDEFVESLFNTPGAVSAGDGDAMPLFNTVKVLLQGAIGRPGVKYLRGMIFGDSLSGDEGLIDAALVTALQTAWDTMQNSVETAGQHLVFGAADKVCTTAVVENFVQMRQQHRKRRRSV